MRRLLAFTALAIVVAVSALAVALLAKPGISKANPTNVAGEEAYNAVQAADHGDPTKLRALLSLNNALVDQALLSYARIYTTDDGSVVAYWGKGRARHLRIVAG